MAIDDALNELGESTNMYEGEDISKKLSSSDKISKIVKSIEKDPFACNNDIFKSEPNEGDYKNKIYKDIIYVDLKNDNIPIVLEESKDNNIYVKGNVKKEELQDENQLFLKNLEGVIKLPHNNNLLLNINNSNSNICGAVVNGGFICTYSGDIDIKLFYPLFVDVKGTDGSINVKGMKLSKVTDCYLPKGTLFPGGEIPLTTLTIISDSGNVNVEYIKKNKSFFEKYF
jgi:hypothetical protein